MAKPQKTIGSGGSGKDYTEKTFSTSYNGSTWTPVSPGTNAGKGNDFLYVTSSVPTLNTGPTFDGGAQPSGGADQILLKTDNLTVNDGFFQYLQNMEVLKLADDLDANGVGTTVTLGINALATGIKEVTGGSGSDIITFTSDYDTTAVKVDGGAGNDEITTAGGNDTIYGGAGADVIDGGAGVDTYVFAATGALNGSDTIGLVAADDILKFASFLPSGAVGQNSGVETAIVAYTAADNLSVNIMNQLVLFDTDGAGLTAAQLAAEFDGASAFALNGKAIVITGDASAPTNAALIYFVDSALDGTAGDVTVGDIVLVGTTSAAFDIDTLTTANFSFA